MPSHSSGCSVPSGSCPRHPATPSDNRNKDANNLQERRVTMSWGCTNDSGSESDEGGRQHRKHVRGATPKPPRLAQPHPGRVGGKDGPHAPGRRPAGARAATPSPRVHRRQAGGGPGPGGARSPAVPGGVGKTRLALEVAVRSRDAFPDGVSFVSLAPLRDAALFPSVLAQSLGIEEAAGEAPQQTLKRRLRDRRMLVV